MDEVLHYFVKYEEFRFLLDFTFQKPQLLSSSSSSSFPFLPQLVIHPPLIGLNEQGELPASHKQNG